MSLFRRTRDGIMTKTPVPVLPSWALLLATQSQGQVSSAANPEIRPQANAAPTVLRASQSAFSVSPS